MPPTKTFLTLAARRPDTPAPALVCSWSPSGLDAAWVHLSGEHDLAASEQLERTLAAPELQAELVVLDLRGLTFIDLAGTRAIADAGIRARRAGRRMVLLRGVPDIDRMFKLAARPGVEISDVDGVEPPVRRFLRLVPKELLS